MNKHNWWNTADKSDFCGNLKDMQHRKSASPLLFVENTEFNKKDSIFDLWSMDCKNLHIFKYKGTIIEMKLSAKWIRSMF